MSKRQGQGRSASIPSKAYDAAFRLHAKGHGCRMIARLLESQGVYTTKSSVSRLLRGQPPYDKGESLT